MTEAMAHSRSPSPADQAMRSEVLQSLQDSPAWLSSKYFYDARGARLFERICTLPEYYPTRSELEILENSLPAIAEALGEDCEIVEPGSGEGIKTRRLLKALHRPRSYRPIDVAGEQLSAAADRLRAQFPELEVRPVEGDFTKDLALPQAEGRRVFYFPGSTIGNFPSAQAQALLRRWATQAGPQGQLLIGVDLRKPKAILEAAYADAQGVTAAFNRNILRHLNRRLGCDFQPEAWAHEAPYDEGSGQIQMWLRPTQPQKVRFPGGPELHWKQGEGIRTEYSCKYSLDEFAHLAQGAGWARQAFWLDSRGWFSLQLYTLGQ